MASAVGAASSPPPGRRKTASVYLLSLLCVGSWLSGCESTDVGDEPDDAARGNVLLRDEHNYRSSASLSIPSIDTAAATDLQICWTDVISDLQCHDVAPQSDLDNVALLRFLRLSEEEVEDRLTASQLAQSEIDGYLEYNTDHESTCTTLSSLSFFRTEIEIEEEYVEDSDHTHMLLFAAGTTPGVGARTMIFVRPTSSSTNTTVNAVPGCGLLDFSADLSSVEAVAIPADGPWVVDWRNVTRDGQGNEIVFQNIDGVLLGFYAGLTVSELEQQIMDLELIATSLWEIELGGGRTADLAAAQGRENGGSFPGFGGDADGVWLLGLMCSTCQNPAPVVLAVLEPSAGGP